MAVISWLCKHSMAVLILLTSVIIAGPILIPMDHRTRFFLIRTFGLIVIQILLTLLSWHIWKLLVLIYDNPDRNRQPRSQGDRQAVPQDERDVVPRRRNRTVVLILKISTAAFLITAQLGIVVSIFLRQASMRWLAWITLTFTGIYIQFITCYAILCLIFFVVSLIQRLLKVNSSKERKARVVAALSLLYCVSLSIIGIYRANVPPVVKRADVDIEGLPPILNGMKILLISDVHMGSTVGQFQLERAVNISNDLKPDIVAVVGDLVDGSVEEFKHEMDSLRHIRNNFGKYFVTGNHEYYHGDVDEWMEYLEKELGFQVLHNSHVKIKAKREFFYLAGTDDVEARTINYPGHGMDLAKAVKECERDRPIVLLAHQPKAAKEALDSDYNIQLVLSGHTHGGQMMPMTLLAYLTNPFYAGLYRYGRGHVYVSQGTVYWGIPMRMFSESEISLITLHSSDKHRELKDYPKYI